MSESIRERIEQLLQLCGEDPSAAFATKHGALPLLRKLEGWLALRTDGRLIFVDDVTGRVLDDLPVEWRAEALDVIARRYPDLEK
jgi:hypothetical protein